MVWLYKLVLVGNALKNSLIYIIPTLVELGTKAASEYVLSNIGFD